MIWTILTHLGLIFKLVKGVEGLVAEVVKTKAMPSCATIDPVLETVEELFKQGVIDIPGIDEKPIADAIQQLRDNLCPKA